MLNSFSPQGRQQSLSLGTNPVCNAEPNLVGSHLSDESMKSIDSGVCHRLWSISWSIVQVCSRTTEYQVFQYVPSTSISRLFVSILVTILQLIQVPLSWNDGDPSKDLRLCTTTLSLCSPVRNISQRISEHVLPCRKTAQPSLCEVFATLVIFQLLQLKFVIRTLPCTLSWQFRSVYIHIECIPNIRDQEMKLVRQDQHCSSISCKWDPYSASLQLFVKSSTFTNKNNPCFRWTNGHSQFGTFPSKFQQNFLQLSFPQETSEWVFVQISFKKNHWIFNVWPRFGLFVSWKTYPYVWRVRFRNSEQSGSVLHF